MDLLLALQSSLDQADVHLRAAAQAAQRGETRNPDPFLGVLSPALFGAEDYNVYGYVSATNVKVLGIIRDGVCKQRRDEDAILRSLLRQLNVIYVDTVCNPFFASLESTGNFHGNVSRIVDHHSTLFQQS